MKKNGIKIAREWQKLKNYKSEASVITGRRNTVKFLTERLKNEERDQIVTLEQAFLRNLKNGNVSRLNMLSSAERRKTFAELRRRPQNMLVENNIHAAESPV